MKKNWFLLAALLLLVGGCGISRPTAVFATEVSAGAENSASSMDGFVTDADGYLYYYKNGVKLTGWQTIGGNTYYFRKTTKSVPTGSAATGLIKIGDYRYYFSEAGILQTGWQTINGKTYYFRKTNKSVPTGSAATGLIKIGDYRYYFSSTGKMLTGWQTINGSTWYFRKSESGTTPKGSAMTGLAKIKGKTYYFSSSGKMKTGVVKIDGKVYYFGSDGSMQTGWQTYNGYDYYFKSTGEAATGSYTIGSYVYVFTSGGKLVKRDTESLVKVSGSWYCVDSQGRAKTSGWFTVDSKLCYAASNGKLKTSTTYGGITFNASGYAVSSTATSLKLKTMSIVSQITTDSMTKSQKLYACWQYMTSSSRWYYTGTYPSSYSSGWQISMAYSMLTSGGGNCYGFACAFAALANEVGYDSYVVVGRVSGTRDGAADGLTRHCWVRINGCYYDPEAQWKGWYTGCYGLSYYGVTHTISGVYRFGLGVG